MSELADIRRRKLEELEQKVNDEENQQKEFMQDVTQLENVVKQRLTRDALSRMGNVKIAHPEVAIQAMIAIANLLQRNQSLMISDKMLKDILLQLTSQRKKINFKVNHNGKI